MVGPADRSAPAGCPASIPPRRAGDIACPGRSTSPPSQHVRRDRSRRRGDPRSLRDRRRAVSRHRAAQTLPRHHGQRQGTRAGADHCWMEAATDPTAPASEEESCAVMPPGGITIQTCRRPGSGRSASVIILSYDPPSLPRLTEIRAAEQKATETAATPELLEGSSGKLAKTDHAIVAGAIDHEVGWPEPALARHREIEQYQYLRTVILTSWRAGRPCVAATPNP